MTIDGFVDSSEIAYFATQKNITDEKATKIIHAFEVNQAIESSLLLPVDPVCTFRNCLHHYSTSAFMDGYHGAYETILL